MLEKISRDDPSYEKSQSHMFQRFGVREEIDTTILAEQLPKLKAEFLSLVDNLRQKNLFPLGTDEVTKRIENVNFSVIDADNIAAHQKEDQNSIKISRGLLENGLDNKATLKHFLFHEMIHVLSGKTIVKEYEDFHGEKISDPFDGFTSRKEGLVHFGKITRFNWLNEAVTEYLTRELSEEDRAEGERDAVYSDDIMLLKLLMTKGAQEIPIESFTNAYFEDYKPNLDKGMRLEKWKELRSQLNKAFSANFILKLDDLILEKGVEYALKHFEE